MKAQNHTSAGQAGYFAFVARFVDAVATEALSTELLAQRRARLQFQAAQHEAAVQPATQVAAPARKAA
jgi:hypothetical protein